MSEESAPRILIADDHVLIRDALPGALRAQFPLAQFAGAATAAEAVAAVTRESWDLVVLDLGLPGAGELDTLRQLRALRPDLPILVQSMFLEEKMGVAAMEAGASGYLCKTADRSAIATAVAETLAGRGYVTDRLRALLARRSSDRPVDISSLSPREIEVLHEIGRGLSNKEIAARLALSVTAVATYRARLMEKLGLRTTPDLLRYIVDHRLGRD